MMLRGCARTRLDLLGVLPSRSAQRVALVSPYCPAPYVRRNSGWHEVAAGENLIGAVTYVFPNAAARLLLADARVVNHRQRGAADGLKDIDSVVGRWAGEGRLPVFYHTPSLAQHIGCTSVIWPRATNDGLRRAADFVGEDFDATASVGDNCDMAAAKSAPQTD